MCWTISSYFHFYLSFIDFALLTLPHPTPSYLPHFTSSTQNNYTIIQRNLSLFPCHPPFIIHWSCIHYPFIIHLVSSQPASQSSFLSFSPFHSSFFFLSFFFYSFFFHSCPPHAYLYLYLIIFIAQSPNNSITKGKGDVYSFIYFIRLSCLSISLSPNSSASSIRNRCTC